MGWIDLKNTNFALCFLRSFRYRVPEKSINIDAAEDKIPKNGVSGGAFFIITSKEQDH